MTRKQEIILVLCRVTKWLTEAEKIENELLLTSEDIETKHNRLSILAL